jgi:integrase
MAGRRGNNEGTVFQRSDGRWCGGVSDGTGRRKFVYAASRQEAARKLNQALHDHLRGLPVADDRITTGALLDKWIEQVASPAVRPLTLERYKTIVTLHLKPALGSIRLTQLKPEHVQALMTAKVKEGLSPATVVYVRNTLRTALNRAIKWGLLYRNVAALADPPRTSRQEIKPLTPEEIDVFLAGIEADSYGPLFTVALTTGLRKGELLGHRWSDVDFEQRQLRVRLALQRQAGALHLVEPKTARSKRVIALTQLAFDAFKREKARQAHQQLFAGSRWHETGLVFTSSIGTPLEPRYVLRRFQELLLRLGIEKRRFHDLRHSCATLLLMQGVAARVVMEILGHSQYKLTMDTYSHVIPALEKDAANRLDVFFQSRGLPQGRLRAFEPDNGGCNPSSPG